MNKVGFAPTKGVCLFKRLDLNQSPVGFYTYRVCLFRHLFIMVGEVGLEPTKPLGKGFTVPRNCHYATRPYVFGADGETRTLDHKIKSFVLFHLSYIRIFCISLNFL